MRSSTGLRMGIMVRLLAGMIVSVCVTADAEEPAFDATKPRTITAVRVQAIPVIDGKLDDACWKKAQPVTNFLSIDSDRPVSYQSIGYICYDDSYIYIAMKCLLPKGVKPTVEEGSPLKKSHDKYCFSDDIVEIMIDPGRSLADYYQLVVSAYGSTFDALRRYGGAQVDTNWNGDWLSGADIGDGYWSMEMAVPFHTLGITTSIGSTWGINLCRAAWKPKIENSTISAMGSYHNMENFAVVEGMNVDFSKSLFQVGPGIMRLESTSQGPRVLFSVPVKNKTKETKKVKVECWKTGVSGKNEAESEVVTLKPGEQKTFSPEPLEVEPLFPGRTDAYLVTSAAKTTKVVVSDAEDGTVLSLSIINRPWFFEVVRIEVDDPWHKRMSSNKTSSVSLQVNASIAEKHLEGGEIVVELLSEEDGEVLASEKVTGPSEITKATLPVKNIPWGAYKVRAVFKDPKGREIVSATAPATILPGGKHRIKVLNNLVSELMNTKNRGLTEEEEIPFMNPRDGWVFFSLSGKGRVTLDGGEKPIAVVKAGEETVEAMRYLPAGRHILRADGKFGEIIARSVPELIYSSYTGEFKWDYLKRNVLPHCNTILGNDKDEAAIKEWSEQGKRWIGFSAAPGHGVGGELYLDAEKYYKERLSKDVGFSHPLFEGVMVDQISSCSSQQKAEIGKMLAWIVRNPDLKGKQYRPWFEGGAFGSAEMPFMKVVLDSGWAFSYYIYLTEKNTVKQVKDLIRGTFTKNAISCNKEYRDSIRRAIVQPGYMSHYPTGHSLDIDPGRNFKILMQMQFEAYANDPNFFGMYGTLWYYSPYVDEENTRWGANLFRHYGIEGKTEPMSEDPYVLPHIDNPDFAEGTKGWTIEESEPGSVGINAHTGYGLLEGRFIAGSKGDMFLTMKRSGKGSNSFSQKVKDLTPGRLYSMKMITADYRNIIEEKSIKQKVGVSIKIDNVEMLEGSRYAYDEEYRSHYGSKVGKFNKDYPAYMNFHWRVFRAKGKKARLIVSDWTEAGEPSGPVGQEVMYNFIEIQPYD